MCIQSALCLTVIALCDPVLFLPYLGFPLHSVCPEKFHLSSVAEANGSSAPAMQSCSLSHPLPLTVALKDFRRTVAFHFQPSHLTQFLLHQEDRSEHTYMGSYRSCQHMTLLLVFCFWKEFSWSLLVSQLRVSISLPRICLPLFYQV